MHKKSIKKTKTEKQRLKHKSHKEIKRGGATNFLPDYKVYEISILEYGSKKKRPLVCNVCKNKGFMLEQAMLSSGRASSFFGLNTFLDKHTQLCVCSNCTHMMMFRKNSFVIKGAKISSRAVGFSYAPHTTIKP
jgi:hypothetical protein